MKRLLEVFDPKDPRKGLLILIASFVLFAGFLLVGGRLLPDVILRVVMPTLLCLLILSVFAVALSCSRIVATKLNLPPLARFPMAIAVVLAAWLILF